MGRRDGATLVVRQSTFAAAADADNVDVDADSADGEVDSADADSADENGKERWSYTSGAPITFAVADVDDADVDNTVADADVDNTVADADVDPNDQIQFC